MPPQPLRFLQRFPQIDGRAAWICSGCSIEANGFGPSLSLVTMQAPPAEKWRSTTPGVDLWVDAAQPLQRQTIVVRHSWQVRNIIWIEELRILWLNTFLEGLSMHAVPLM